MGPLAGLLLLWLPCLLTASHCAAPTDVVAPFPLGPKPKVTRTRLEDDLFVTDDGCGERRPFYVPGEALDVYTVTLTETGTQIVTTSRIINQGTSTTLTISLTLTSTVAQTTTELRVSTTFATTTVQLSLTVDGGLVTRTSVVDTIVYSTVYVTPTAATAISIVTRFTRTTTTSSVLATVVSQTLQTVTELSTATIPFISLTIEYADTSTLTIFNVAPVTTTIFTSLLGYTSTNTPDNFSVVSRTYFSLQTSSDTIMVSSGTIANFIFVPAPVLEFTPSASEPFVVTLTTTATGPILFTEYYYSTVLIGP